MALGDEVAESVPRFIGAPYVEIRPSGNCTIPVQFAFEPAGIVGIRKAEGGSDIVDIAGLYLFGGMDRIKHVCLPLLAYIRNNRDS